MQSILVTCEIHDDVLLEIAVCITSVSVLDLTTSMMSSVVIGFPAMYGVLRDT